jgi:hypothetical protein
MRRGWLAASALLGLALIVTACSRSEDASKQKTLNDAKRDSERQQQAIQNTLANRRQNTPPQSTPVASATP